MSMIRTVAGLLAGALTLVVLVPGVAVADSRRLHDGPGDVWLDRSSSAEASTPAPSHRRGDILRTSVRHGARQVVVRTRFAALDRQGRRLLVLTRLRTDAGVVRSFVLVAGAREANGWRGVVTRRDARTEYRCGVRHRIDYAADVAVVRIPRRCLGGPRWVQMTMGVVSFEGLRVYVDNPSNDGPTQRLPAYTRRILRG